MTVQFDVADHVARVTIDRPEVLNAVDLATEAELQRIWGEIERDDAVWCVVLTGGGDRAFCAGADLSDANQSDQGADYWMSERPGGFGGIALRRTLNVPVVARVNGYALGGGFEMVLGCDIAVAADTAQFGLTEPRVGFIPMDGGAVLLPRLTGSKQAMGLLLTGRRIKAAEALEFGLINEAVAADALDEAVDRWVEMVLACSPPALRAIKETVLQTGHLSPQEAVRQRLPAVVDWLRADDTKEGLRAFQEKRPPRWSGR